MKGLLKILILVVVSFFAGSQLHRCQSGSGGYPAGERECVRDTMVYVDTVKEIAPVPVSQTAVGTMRLTVPLARKKGAEASSKDTMEASGALSDSSALFRGLKIPSPCMGDSVEVELPMVQRVYEQEEYTAWVGGVYPRLDSIAVYPKREVVTIRQPPNRWHIGITAGYGYTAKGFAPYIGVGITYSIFSF